MRAPVPLSLLVCACGFNFADPGQVVDRRILSIVADPPQLHTGVNTVSVNALVVEPGDTTPTDTFSWTLCVASPEPGGGGAAPGGFGAASATRCDDAGIVLAQGTAPLDALNVTVPVPKHLPAIAELQIELNVGGDGGLYGVKRIFAPPTNADPPNTNPVLSGVTFDGTEWPEDGGLSVTPGACVTGMTETMRGVGRLAPTLTFCAHTVAPEYDAAEHQPYTTTDALGNVMMLNERLRFAWFSDRGTIERDTTSEPGGTGLRPASSSAATDAGLSTTWREPVDGGTEATVWVVVRDGRGGESYTKRVVHFVTGP